MINNGKMGLWGVLDPEGPGKAMAMLTPTLTPTLTLTQTLTQTLKTQVHFLSEVLEEWGTKMT